MAQAAMTETNLPGMQLIKQGKVRDIYDLGEYLLIISTDRISAFDCVLPDGIPLKGIVLNVLSAFWFDNLKDLTPHHMVTINPDEFPAQLSAHRQYLDRRAMLVQKTEPIEVECVVRGYLAGSAWHEYSRQGTIGALPAPRNLKEGSQLPEPLFTPSTKASSGHDVPISFQEMTNMIGSERAQYMRRMSLDIYRSASNYLLKQGFILADTKLEFGMHNNNIILIDECITPDSSRFWLRSAYTPGKHQESFDKQFVRDYLSSLGWDKLPPAPSLPFKTIQETSRIYQETFQRITGKRLSPS